MPLHNWDEIGGWDGMHHLWITHLFHSIKPRLPTGFRAFVGSVPTLSVQGDELGSTERPDVAVRHWLGEPPAEPPAAESVAASLLEPEELAELREALERFRNCCRSDARSHLAPRDEPFANRRRWQEAHLAERDGYVTGRRPQKNARNTK